MKSDKELLRGLIRLAHNQPKLRNPILGVIMKHAKMDEDDVEEFVDDLAWPERKDGQPQGWWQLAKRFSVDNAGIKVKKLLYKKLTPLVEKHESGDDATKKQMMKEMKPYLDAIKTGDPNKLSSKDKKEVLDLIESEISKSRASDEKKEQARQHMSGNSPKKDETSHFDPNFTQWAGHHPWDNPNKDSNKKTITWNTLRTQYPDVAKKHYEDWKKKNK